MHAPASSDDRTPDRTPHAAYAYPGFGGCAGPKCELLVQRDEADTEDLQGYNHGDVEIEVFRRLDAFGKAGEWKSVVDLSRSELIRVPAWSTPYCFLGVAYAKLQRREEAIDALNNFL